MRVYLFLLNIFVVFSIISLLGNIASAIHSPVDSTSVSKVSKVLKKIQTFMLSRRPAKHSQTKEKSCMILDIVY